MQKTQIQQNTGGRAESVTTTSDLLTSIPRLTPQAWLSLNPMVRWFIMIRGPVLVMTVSAALLGIGLAYLNSAENETSDISLLKAAAIIIGLSLAHATNNLVNDWVDYQQGTDKDNYFRHQYGTHVLAANLISTRHFLLTTLATALPAVVCAGYLAVTSHEVVLYLVAAGTFFVLFYTWPLKHFALGEVTVLLVWGPMMITGSYLVLTAEFDWTVLGVALLAGIGPTLVIFGKHMDKLEQDQAKGIHTLPVLLGHDHSRAVCLLLLAVKWPLLLCLMLWQGNWWLAPSLLAVPALMSCFRCFRRAAPEHKPDHYPDEIWPLWYAAFAFRYARDFGIALLLGLLISLVLVNLLP